jgi:hypothetical protein
MSEQQSALTYEGILEMFRESGREFDRRMEETNRQMKETDRKMEESNRKFDRMVEETNRIMRETSKKISELGSRIGEIIENMVGGNIVAKFQALGYDVEDCCRNVSFRNRKLGISGEIDLLLGDGDIAILIEVKTNLETADVRNHIERLEKYRRYADVKDGKNKSRFIGAVAGAVVTKETKEFAHANGLYVIVQSGEAFEIVATPTGFTAKEW